MMGSEAVMAQLVAEGVEVVLSIPGVHNVFLCDAVLNHQELRFVGGRHEQGITFMANGYARACGKIAVPLVVTGPGVTNSLTALADAYTDSVPMVLIAAQANLDRLGKGAFHELKDQTGLLASVTKWSTCVERTEDIPDAIRTAFEQAYDGRPGPTAVEIPMDVQSAEGMVDIYPHAQAEREGAAQVLVHEAARRLEEAQMPVVYVGNGAAASECSAELIQLIERLNAVCLTTALAKGVVPDDHPLYLGWGGASEKAAHQVLKEADVVLVVGSSLDEADTGQWTLRFPDDLIQIDTCADMIGRNYPVSVGLLGDAREVLSQLLEALPADIAMSRPSPAERIANYKEQVRRSEEGTPGWQFMAAMARALPTDAVVTNDASGANGWAIRFLPRALPRTFNITRNMAALGYAFPAAIGAKLAYPDRQAVAVIGDGGFLFTVYSLATAVQHRLNAVVVVFNDATYSSIRRTQLQRFERTIGVDLQNPDFVKLAEAYGAFGLRAENPDQLYDGLMAAWQRDLPTLIEVPLERDGF